MTLLRLSSSPGQAFPSQGPILPSQQHSLYHPAPPQIIPPTLDIHSATHPSYSPTLNPYSFLPQLPSGKTSPKFSLLPAPRLIFWTSYCTEQLGFHVQLVDSENTDGYFLLFFYILPNPLPPEARTVLHRTGTQKLGQSTQRPLVTLSTINICFAHQGLQPW